MRGRFATRDFALVREVERRTRARVGFGWARWGDAEMISSARDGSPMRLAVRALMSVSATPNCVLNVGVHWLCNGALRNNWNAAMDGVDVNDTIGHAFFFLPMGDPGDDDRSMWKENGVDGYINVVREAKRKVILVGPPHVEGLPFIGHSAFVDASGKGMGGDGAADSVVQRIFEIGDAFDEPPVVIMAAGMAAKTAILSAQDRINSKGAFIGSRDDSVTTWSTLLKLKEIYQADYTRLDANNTQSRIDRFYSNVPVGIGIQLSSAIFFSPVFSG